MRDANEYSDTLSPAMQRYCEGVTDDLLHAEAGVVFEAEQQLLPQLLL